MKFTAATLLALPLLAVATPFEARQDRDCDPGSLQCCNSTVSVSTFTSSDSVQCAYNSWTKQSSSTAANTLAGLLGIVLGDLTGLLGLGCSAIGVGSVGSGNACTSSPVCCSSTTAVSSLDFTTGGLLTNHRTGWFDRHRLCARDHLS